MKTISKETFRNRLLKYFGLIIVILTFSSGVTLYQAYRTNTVSNQLFNKLFTTSSLTIKMGTVHQNLKNYINYENSELLPVFTESLEELVSSFEKAQDEIVGDKVTTDNQSLYYKFIDIRNMVTSYYDSSLALVEGADFTNHKYNIFDSFYELEQLKDFIYLSQTDLIFRQMVIMEGFFTTNSRNNNRIFIILLMFTLLLIGISILSSLRITKTVTKPMQQLVEQAKNVSQGIFNKLIVPFKVSVELEILIKTFNHMVSEIQKRIEELKHKAQIEQNLMQDELKILRMEHALNQSELLFLQSQMNPHFLFNTINTISSIADIEEADQTREMLDSMSTILRYNLRLTGKNTKIREELNVIEHYINIQKKRFGERIQFHTDIDESCLEWSIPSMIIQPLVENAVIHGLEPKEETGRLTLSIRKAGKGTLITVSDNGAGMPPEIIRRIESSDIRDPDNRKHLGIINIIRRLELSYHTRCISFSTIPSAGTEVKILLPYSLS